MENHKSCDDFLGEQDIGVVIIDEQHTNRLQQIIQAHGDPQAATGRETLAVCKNSCSLNR